MLLTHSPNKKKRQRAKVIILLKIENTKKKSLIYVPKFCCISPSDTYGFIGGTLGLRMRVAVMLRPRSPESDIRFPINNRSEESSSTPRPNQRPQGKLPFNKILLILILSRSLDNARSYILKTLQESLKSIVDIQFLLSQQYIFKTLEIF